MDSNESKCPICGKAGISDYKKEDVVCPACNTDLSIYRTIDKRNRNHKFLQILSGIFFLIIASLFFFRPTKQFDIKREGLFQDSINIMQSQVNLLRSQIDSLKGLNNEGAKEFFYIVTKGDSFSKISRRFYHTEKYASEIASLNGLSLNSIIHPEMKIKIPQE